MSSQNSLDREAFVRLLEKVYALEEARILAAGCAVAEVRRAESRWSRCFNHVGKRISCLVGRSEVIRGRGFDGR